MTSFSQLGDPVCPVCLCEHHGAAYGWHIEQVTDDNPWTYYWPVANGAEIVAQSITTTKRCCIVVMSAVIAVDPPWYTALKLEQPSGTDITKQSEKVTNDAVALMHYAAWEVLPAGTYRYHLMNRTGAAQNIYNSWIKIVASDCEG